MITGLPDSTDVSFETIANEYLHENPGNKKNSHVENRPWTARRGPKKAEPA
jgi:hypothetical protein